MKNTGPTVDASGNSSGFYFHFDARLSPLFSMHPISVLIPNPSKSSKGCLKFAYHMNGGNTGSLSVILSSSNVPPRTVWLTAGDLESVWEDAAVSLQLILKSSIPSFFNLTFVAMKGNGSRGEIAIDNVLVTYGSNCVVVAKATTRTTATSEQNTDLKKVIAIATGGFVFVQIIFLLICVVIRRKVVQKVDDTPTVPANVEMEGNEDYEIIQPNPSYYANIQGLQLNKHSEHDTKTTNPKKLTEVEMQNTINEYTSVDD
ncbi:MAM domain-containing protein 2-like [Hydractinia symbiolongicarpus]|uniref:MAM domain-containing protein 2-like n=1 Tax=Hydractinia symbiolongicarpus TaxID=13093 RepID=UPI00254B0A8A|nr:MAM domain-containing protein 2-like [Hydractinia symbiolongicarpus]